MVGGLRGLRGVKGGLGGGGGVVGLLIRVVEGGYLMLERGEEGGMGIASLFCCILHGCVGLMACSRFERGLWSWGIRYHYHVWSFFVCRWKLW